MAALDRKQNNNNKEYFSTDVAKSTVDVEDVIVCPSVSHCINPTAAVFVP